MFGSEVAETVDIPTMVERSFNSLVNPTGNDADNWPLFALQNGPASLLKQVLERARSVYAGEIFYFNAADAESFSNSANKVLSALLDSGRRPNESDVILMDNIEHILDDISLQTLATTIFLIALRTDRVRCIFYSSVAFDTVKGGLELRKLILDGTIDIRRCKLQSSSMVRVNSFALRRQIAEVCSRRKISDPQFVSEIANICEQHIKDRTVAENVENLNTSPLPLPPAPRTLWADRREMFGSKIDVETFLNNVWKQYLDEKLLYAEHLRRIDPGLYKAFQYNAYKAGLSIDEYLEPLGVLTRRRILRPTPEIQKQAELLRTARLVSRAQRASARDDDFSRER